MKHLEILSRKRYSAGFFSLAALVLGLFIGVPSPAWAGFQLFDGRDTCSGDSCSSQSYMGIYERNSNNSQAIPFTIQVYSAGNECVRLDVFSQPSDLEIVFVAPDGTVWRDNDGGPDTRPLVKARTPDVNGWYTVHISRDTGGGGAGIFGLRYGRYDINNANCFSPTQPLLF